MIRIFKTTILVGIIAIIIFFGLRPKGSSPDNTIEWQPQNKAISLNRSGIAYIDDLRSYSPLFSSDDFTIQLKISVNHINKVGFRPLLMIHSGSDCDQLVIWQWGASIIAMNGDDYDYSRKAARLSAADILQPGVPVTISLTAGKGSTTMFVNGELFTKHTDWQIAIPRGGNKARLVLGNSVYAKHSWQGVVYGLDVYPKALSAEQISMLHSRGQSSGKYSGVVKGLEPLRYTFSQSNGRTISDLSEYQVPLIIPHQLVILKKAFMTAPWHRFSFNTVFLNDVLINVAGFIPLGIVLYWFIFHPLMKSAWHARAAALLSCFVLSFMIETIQVWLPFRNSSLLDLLSNTVGSALGVALISWYMKVQYGKEQPVQQREEET